MLDIQKYLKKYGLNKTILDFNLKTKEYNHKILLKYDQLSSPKLMSLPEMQDCRGIILEKDTWKLMSLAFRKFFNVDESNAAKIDWNTAEILEKIDGTMIQVYWDWVDGKWYAGTTGTANGEGEVNNKLGTTFNNLFWKTVKEKYNLDENKFNKKYCYIFELTTPYNIVVKPHGESSATLLTIRDLETFKEVSRLTTMYIADLFNIPVVKSYDFNNKNISHLLKTFENMPWSEEGYVVRDCDDNRVKIKNPAYVAIHHLKGKTAEHNILTIVKTNEIEEFASTFPDRKDELYRLKESYDLLIIKLKIVWNILQDLKPKNKEEQKKFAAAVFDVCGKNNLNMFTGLYFGLAQNKIKTIEDYMFNYDDKTLYKIL